MGWIISGQRQSLSKLELTKDEVVLRNLAIADLLLEGVVAIVDLGVQVGLRERFGNLGRVLFLYTQNTRLAHQNLSQKIGRT